MNITDRLATSLRAVIRYHGVEELLGSQIAETVNGILREYDNKPKRKRVRPLSPEMQHACHSHGYNIGLKKGDIDSANPWSKDDTPRQWEEWRFGWQHGRDDAPE